MKKLSLVFMLLLSGLASLLAQRTITGKVIDQGTKDPLIGATILAKGTSAGTVTDVDGSYSLSAPANATSLIISYTGFVTREIELGSSNVVDVELESDILNINEVVVVGYGTQQRRDITGTISSIKGSDLAASPVQSFDQALQGRAAGVNVSLPNGVLNNPPVFRIRGINSINLSSFPLIVLDGVPTFTGDQSGNNAANNVLSNINPNDIESIEILKDAAAAAIYGSRASAGVVLITTKRGKEGKTKISYDGWAGFTSAARRFDLLNAEQYVAYKNEAARNANLPDQFFLETIDGKLVDTDWYDYILQTGKSQNHGLSFSGGNAGTTYFLSLGYSNQEGMIVSNTFERLSGRLSLDHKLGKKVKVGANLGYTTNSNAAPSTGSLPGQAFGTSGLGRIPLVTAPNIPAYNADGSYNIASNNQPGRYRNLQQVGFVNPVTIIDLNSFTSEADQLQAAVFVDVNLFKGLTYRTQYGIDQLSVENISFQTPVHGDGFGTNGAATNTVSSLERWNWQHLLTYDFSLAEKHNFSFLVGNEQQRTVSSSWGAQRTVIGDPFFTTYQGNFTTIVPAGNGQGENYLLSYFGRLNYDFKKIFLMTANLRQDEYSAFAPGKKAGIFWGASAGLTLSEMDFWKNSLGNAINFFRIRGSYGEVGNNNGIGDFASLSTYGSGLYGTNATTGFNQAGNTNLSWETSRKTDIGINFGLLEDRLTGEITYFKNDIDGLILNSPQAPSKGIPGNSIQTNIGAMQNTGWEFGLTGTIVKKAKFSWTSNFNIAFMQNEVTALAAGNTDIFTATAGLETANIIRVGQSIGSLYVVPTDGVDPATGRRVFINAKGERILYSHVVPSGQSRWTVQGTGATSPAVTVAADGKIFGPVLPTYFGAWDNTFRFHGIDFNVQVQYSGGNYVYNGTKAGLRDQRFWNNEVEILTRWQKDGDVTNIPRPVLGDNVSNGSSFPISENVEKGDFVRIRNITMGYTLPKNLTSRINVNNVRVYGTVNNAFLFTQYTGTDPEVSTNGNSNGAPGVDRNSVPMARTISVGLNVGF
ncbi:MAG: TonB-dependent receptor [Haliscomenobacter sp.]|nr:TonB-dependent receptor [Haliscomenobacter sp.]MBK9489621.1 TonB-dependent receptor [Haliscomenobacter sp.]